MQTVKRFSDFNIAPSVPRLIGAKIQIEEILNLEIMVLGYEITDSKYKSSGKCLYLQISNDDIKRVVFTSAKPLMEDIQKVPKDGFPFITKIIKDNKRFIFS